MMWEGGNCWAEGRSSIPMAAASFHSMMHGIHVLLVDHDPEALVNTAKNLELCHYKVTFVELASAAIAMILTEKAKFDVVMANINSPDLHGLKLLQHSVHMCIPVVLMSADDNAHMAMRALEDGAFLYIKKPLQMEFLRCLWQHVVREKTRMIRERELLVASNNLRPGIEFRDPMRIENPNPNPNPIVPIHYSHHPYANPNSHPNAMMMMKNKGKNKSKTRCRDDEECDSRNNTLKGNVRRKMCTEWTQQLHAKFMDAIEKLGEGRCFPKEILEMMNVPGLTRMQVASHLQKCRNDNWRSPEERKSSSIIHQTSQHATSSGNEPQPKPRRFGSKPVQIGGSQVVQTKTTLERGQGSGTPVPNNVPKTGNNNDQFFNFLDMAGGGQQQQQQPSGINNQGRINPQAYNDDVQNYGETSSQTNKSSRWSSDDTSNLDSDHSETKVSVKLDN